MSTQHNTPIAPSGQPSQANDNRIPSRDFVFDHWTRQFTLAFIPTTGLSGPLRQPNNLTQLWSLKASEVIGALIDFRSAIHRWQAAGKVNDADFIREFEKLEDCGLAGWTDELIGLACAATCASEVTR